MKEQKELENQLYRQKKVVAELQDKINLLKFDVIQANKENKSLKEKLKCRKENIKNIRAELVTMKRKNDYTKINNVLAMLNAGWEEDYDN